jgi:hypothetical protein
MDTFAWANPRKTLRRSAALVTLAAVALTLAGCAPSTPASTPRASTASATAVPSTPATSTPAKYTPAAQVFGGACDAALSDAQVGVALGTSMAKSALDESIATPESSAAAVIGGLECDWRHDASATSAQLQIDVIPSAAAAPPTAAAPYCYGSDGGTSGQGSCRFSSGGTASASGTASGSWISGVVYTQAGSTNAVALAAAKRLITQFAKNAASSVAFVPAAAVAGVWSHSMTCAGLAGKSQVSAALTGTGMVVAPSNGTPEQPAGHLSALTAAGYVGCSWAKPGRIDPAAAGTVGDFEIQVLPGGAWAQAQVAAEPGATKVDIPGVGSAVLVNSDNMVMLNVFDGPNWLTLMSNSTTPVDLSYGGVAAALVASLNEAR